MLTAIPALPYSVYPTLSHKDGWGKVQEYRIYPGPQSAAENLSLRAGFGVAIQFRMGEGRCVRRWIAASQTLLAMTAWGKVVGDEASFL